MKKVILHLIYIALLPIMLMSCNDDIFVADYIVPDTSVLEINGNGEGCSVDIDGRKIRSVRIVTAFTCDFTLYDSDDWVVGTSTGHEAELSGDVAYVRLLTETLEATVWLGSTYISVAVEENLSQSSADFNLICVYTDGSEYKIPVEVTPGAGYFISDVRYDFSSVRVGEEYADEVIRRHYYNYSDADMTVIVSPYLDLRRGLLMEFDNSIISIAPGGQLFEIPTMNAAGQVGLYNVYGSYREGQDWFVPVDKDNIGLSYTLPAGCTGEAVITPYLRNIKIRYEADVINAVSGRVRQAAGWMTVAEPVRYEVDFIITE